MRKPTTKANPPDLNCRQDVALMKAVVSTVSTAATPALSTTTSQHVIQSRKWRSLGDPPFNFSVFFLRSGAGRGHRHPGSDILVDGTKIGTNCRQHRNDDNRNEGCNQAILNRRGAGIIIGEARKNRLHDNSPREPSCRCWPTLRRHQPRI